MTVFGQKAADSKIVSVTSGFGSFENKDEKHAFGNRDTGFYERRNVDSKKETYDSETLKENDGKYIPIDSFEHMGLKEPLLRGIYEYGYECPSAIQRRAILPIIGGRHIVAQAQSGSGKTATFSIAIFQKINVDLRETQAIVLAPTRELAQQIEKVMTGISKHLRANCVACTGGSDVMADGHALRSNPHVVIGTPGRILDVATRGWLSMDRVKIVVLDEADEMLSSGFGDQVASIFGIMSEDTQIVLLSATISDKVREMANNKKVMPDPVVILVKADELTLEGIQQFYINVENDANKLETLCDIYSSVSLHHTVIFCNHKRGVDHLVKEMKKRDFPVAFIHGGMGQSERYEVIRQFRTNNFRVLIATDIIARGIDIQQVSTVINYDLPIENDSYIHRIGRSGRFGRKGLAINFVTDKDMARLEEISRCYGTKIEELPSDQLPSQPSKNIKP